MRALGFVESAVIPKMLGLLAPVGHGLAVSRARDEDVGALSLEVLF